MNYDRSSIQEGPARPANGMDFGQQRAVLFEQYRASCAAIALLSLHELAVAVRAAFPQAELLVLGDGEGDFLEFEHAEDAGGQIVADAEQAGAAGIDAATLCSNAGTNDIGRDTWIRYAPYQRWQNTYHCPMQPILDLPADLLTTPAATQLGKQAYDLSSLRARVTELEEFVADIAALTKEGELPGRPGEDPCDLIGHGDADDDADGAEGKEWENDDAFDTLHDLISGARQLTLPTRHHTAADQQSSPASSQGSQTSQTG